MSAPPVPPPQLPADLWSQVLDNLAVAEVAAPLALTCKYFMRHARQRLEHSRRRAKSLRLTASLTLGSAYLLARVDRKSAGRLFAVRRIPPGAEQHALEVWSLRSGKLEAALELPDQVCIPEELLCSPDGAHVALTYYKYISLLRFDATASSITLLRGFDLEDVDAPHPLDPEAEPLESYVSVARFSPDGRRIALAHLHGILESVDSNRRVQVTAANESLQRCGGDGAGPAGEGLPVRFELPTAYDGQTLSLCGVQVNPAPMQILIPPNRIADDGFVIGEVEPGGGRVEKTLRGFFQSQVLGYSPDGRTLLETRECTGAMRPAAVEGTDAHVYFHSTDGTSGHHGASYASDDAQAKHVALALDGDLLSVQFSADSSTLLLLHGWPHGARAGVSCITGWTSIRRCDSGIAASVDHTAGGGEPETALALFHLGSSARVSGDGSTLYARDAADGAWAAYDVRTGERLWSSSDGGRSDDSAGEGEGGGARAGGEEDEVTVLEGVGGFAHVGRTANRAWVFSVFR